jgi:hypothetical protein
MKSENKCCFLCDIEIDHHNDSQEHVIPRAIGGRLTVSGFICRSCNSHSGEKWDSALAAQLNPLSLLLRIQRQGGNVPAQNFKTTTGQEIKLHHDGNMSLPFPQIKRAEENGIATIHVSASSHKVVRQAIKGIRRKENLNINLDESLIAITDRWETLEDPITMSLDFGGPDAGRSIVKTALSFAAKNGVPASACHLAIQYLNDPQAEACFGYYYDSDLISGRPDDKIFHCVALDGSPDTGLLIAYIEFFSARRMVVTLSDSYAGSPVHNIYAIDPVSSQKLDLKFHISLSRADIGAIYAYKKIPPNSMEDAFSFALSVAKRNEFNRKRDDAINDGITHAMKKLRLGEDDQLKVDQIPLFTEYVWEKLGPFLRRHMPAHNQNIFLRDHMSGQ